MTSEHEYAQRVSYQIIVKGVLDSTWSDWFDGFIISVQDNETVLTGGVPDQSALHGILAKINDLGLPLVSVTKR